MDRIAAFVGQPPPPSNHYTKRTIPAIHPITVESRRNPGDARLPWERKYGQYQRGEIFEGLPHTVGARYSNLLDHPLKIAIGPASCTSTERCEGHLENHIDERRWKLVATLQSMTPPTVTRRCPHLHPTHQHMALSQEGKVETLTMPEAWSRFQSL